jgi:UDP-4-amino-4,6-dideoxy-N-acetyl-beta-L-altrosamine transaminase
MIPYGRQHLNDQDIQAVVDVLKSDWLTQGPAVPRFEEAVANYCGARFAVASSNATAALHLACVALGIGPGDTVWTSPNTFVASANCALYCDAKIDFVDIDPATYNMSVDALREKLITAERQGTLPKLVIPVHFAGQSCQMREIKVLSEQYGFRIIEDASHAIGARYLDDPVGGCRYSDITVFSFHPVKIITTGEGGMALTNDPILAQRLRLFQSHGITRDADSMQNKSDGPWYYEQIELGFNYRMTDIQAALGASQLLRLNEFCECRREMAVVYDDVLDGQTFVLPWQHPDTLSSYHLYPIQFPNRGAINRKQAVERLRALGVGVNVHYIPVHMQPYYQRLGFRPGDFPVAEKYYSQAISLPIFPAMSKGQQQVVIDTLKALVV